MGDLICELKNISAEKYLPRFKDSSIDMILTDLPYNISKKSGFKSIGTKGIERFAISTDYGAWDKSTLKEHFELLENVFKESYRILKDGGCCVCFYDMWKISFLKEILKKEGFKMLRIIEWVKTNPVPLNSKTFYLSNSREFAIACVKKGKPKFMDKYHNGLFYYPIHRDDGKRIHPTQKSLKLMKTLIELHTDEGDSILDMFAGSATTSLAALMSKRNSYGSEKSRIYYQAAMKRIDSYKKKYDGILTV